MIGRGAALIYGIASYLVFFYSLLYAVGFIGKYLVPNSIDVGSRGASMIRAVLGAFALSLQWCWPALAAPDEEKLGKAQHYPVGNAANWEREESSRVGSFTHQGEIPGLFHGTVNVLEPAAKPLRLPVASVAADYRWSIGDAHGLTVDDYLARQRITGLLITKDGVISGRALPI